MGKGAKKYSKEFTWEKSVENYDNLIKEMLSLKDEDIQPRPHIDRYKAVKSKDVSVVIVNYNSS